MDKESLRPAAIWKRIKGETPRTRRGRIVKRVLTAGAILGLVAYADFVQTGARGVFDNYDSSKISGSTPFGKGFNTCDLQEDLSQVDVIKERIKQRFNVDILSPNKIPSLETSREDGERMNVDTVEWDAKSLLSLNEALCAVPQNMYSTRSEYKTTYEVNFATNPVIQDYYKNGLPDNVYKFEFKFPNNITYTISRDQMQQGLDYLKKGSNQIYWGGNVHDINMQFVLVEKDFQSGDVLAHGQYRHGNFSNSQSDTVALVRQPEYEYYFYLQTIVHEITHRIHAVKGNKMDTELFQILGVKDQLEFKEAKFAKKDNINSILFSLKNALSSTIKEKSITMGVFALLESSSIDKLLEYGKRNSNEFTSVGSEYYVYGREFFLTIYSNFMGSERASKFYDFLKDNVFEGKEY